jgi:hypothetical protein
MLSRALILATVGLLIGGFAGAPAPVQAQNLEAGKSPSQIFAGTCAACHKSARGLLRTVAPGALTGFLRQHYTTSPEMAGLLGAYLISNGAADRRYGGGQPRAGRPASDPSEQPDHQVRRPRGAAAEEGTKPDADGSRADRRGRHGKRLARPQDDKPGVEGTSKESSKGDSAKPAAESAKDEGGKPSTEGVPEAAKSEASRSEPVKSEAPKETGNSQIPALQADPVPPATPAPATPPSAAASSAPEPTEGPSSATSSVPAANQPAAAHEPPAVTDSAPPSASVAPGSAVSPSPK